MAAPTLETNAAANILRIISGTSGDPVTWNDVWDWDDGGGSSGGDGDVPKDEGGTVKVNTFMTEHVADELYQILENIQFGNAANTTYFVSKNEAVYFDDDKGIKIKALATLRLGASESGFSVDGAYWSFKPSSTGSWNWIIPDSGSASFLEVYASKFVSRSNNEIVVRGGDNVFENSILSSTGTKGWNFTHLQNSISFNDMTFEGSASGLLLKISPTSAADLRIHNITTYGLEIWASCTLKDVWFSDIGVYDVFTFNDGTVLTLKDPKNFPASPAVVIGSPPANSSAIIEQYTCNIHVVDKDGTALESATILCVDQTDTEEFSVSTDANGDIAEQTIDYRKWATSLETLTSYSPHKFTISKAGYETLELDAIIVDAPIIWHLELLPALAEGDVRLGTGFGEDKTGSLDLPSINDVEDGVFFDSLSKEGNFEAPAEADVELGVGYGSLGTEFEGTYLGLSGTNLDAILEDDVNMIGILEEETNMIGEMEA